MLTPEQISEAGDMVAAVYRQIEAEMLDRLVEAMISGSEQTMRSVTDAAFLSQNLGPELNAVIDAHRDEIDAALRETVERFLEISDSDDIDRIGGEPKWPETVDATVQGVAAIIERDNLQMVEGAKRAFITASAEAVTQVNTGAKTREQAIRRAVRTLEREGIDTITYQNRETGRVSVRNKVDVAVRRHVRTQLAQVGAAMTEARMKDIGCDLVEVSSHCDARPEHAEWQGRCYSLRGERVIDGTRYPDFYAKTQYGSVTGLMGANCRHSFGPYRHGMPHAYEPNPKHPSGLPGDEIYRLEQEQRYCERRIRAAKRELRGAQMLYEADPSQKNLTALNRTKAALRDRQEGIRNLIDEANAKSKKPGVKVLTRNRSREWAGDMPKGNIRTFSRPRDLASGMRGSNALSLTSSERNKVIESAESIGIPSKLLDFDHGTRTSYADFSDRINVKGDVFPDESSSENRDRMTERAVLAHEFYGHRRYRGTKLDPGDWRDEFRASYRAAIDTPGLTNEERASLMVDAYQRASEAGKTLRFTDDYRKIVYGY